MATGTDVETGLDTWGSSSRAITHSIVSSTLDCRSRGFDVDNFSRLSSGAFGFETLWGNGPQF